MILRGYREAQFPILFFITLPTLFAVTVNAEGNVTCSGTGMDWYTTHVGETPCKTYERLRQICNPDFEVGVMNTNTPPDFCNEQLSECCCNSVAFALSMLCLNCQQNIGSGSGYDAGNGAYEIYLQGDRTSGTCSPVQNQTLPNDIQAAVCNEKINIFDDLYTLFWTPGAWYYVYTQQTITKNIAAKNNNTFTHCASTTLNATSSSLSITASSTSSSTQSSSSASSSTSSGNTTAKQSGLSGGAKGGIAVGAILVVSVLGFIAWWLLRRKRNEKGFIPPENNVDPFTPGIGEIHNQAGPYTMPSFSGANLYNYNVVSQADVTTLTPGAGYSKSAMANAAGMSSPSGPTSSGGSSSGEPSSRSGYPKGSTVTAPVSSQAGHRMPETGPVVMAWTGARSTGLSSDAPTLSPVTESPNVGPELERHVDGGRVPEEMIDGRPPPAYGEQID